MLCIDDFKSNQGMKPNSWKFLKFVFNFKLDFNNEISFFNNYGNHSYHGFNFKVNTKLRNE